MAYKIRYSDYVTASGPPDPIRWVGPPGPPGPQGEQGEQGEPGPPGEGVRIEPDPASVLRDNPAQSIFIGEDAGASYPSGSETFGSVAIGPAALSKMTSIGSENVAVGAWAAQYATGGLLTAIGMHALGASEDGTGTTGVGNDVFRDAYPGQYVTGVGQAALAHGAPSLSVAVGSQAMSGMSAGIIVSGSVHAGDTIALGITSVVTGLTGLPVSKTYTVKAGDTIGSIATGIAGLLDQSMYGTPFILRAFANDLPDGTSVVHFNFPGSATLGWKLAITAVPSGGALVSCAVVPGSTASGCVAIGNNAMAAPALGGAINDTFVGDSAGATITSGNYNVAVGWHAANSLMSGGANAVVGALSMPVATTGGDNAALGFWTLLNLTTGGNNTVVGSRSGRALTTGAYNLILGANTAQGTLATGSNNILIQSGNRGLDTAAAGTSDTINIENILTVTGTDAPAASKATFAGAVGVNGAVPPTKPTVSGSRAGNVALASLLTALASYGLITDGSTA